MNKWGQAGRLIGVGFFIGGSIVLGIVLGIWLDNKYNFHFFWLIGLLGGLGVATWGVYRMLVPLMKNNTNGKNGGKSL